MEQSSNHATISPTTIKARRVQHCFMYHAIVILLSSTFILPADAISDSVHIRPSQTKGVDDAIGLAREASAEWRESNAALHISARGDLMRREAADVEAASLVAAESSVHEVSKDPAVVNDGSVTLVNGAQTLSEQTKLEELTEECMMTQATAECMEKYGSYGVRKMFTETWDHVEKLGYPRPGWMSHPEVQKRRLFELTLPGTMSSGTYAINGEDAVVAGASPFGVVSQNLDFYQQLQMGFRAFEIRVAYSTQFQLVYISHGALMIPIATALKDIKRFLQEHEREVVILDVKKDPNAAAGHLQPFLVEEQALDKIPGQLVHEAVACEFTTMLATYAVLAQLPGSEMAENPTIKGLTDVGGRVIYFWDSQQVLCTSFTECRGTNGWWPKTTAHMFAFGPPQPLHPSPNARINATGGRATARIIEPACMSHSTFYTRDGRPQEVVRKIKEFAKSQSVKTQNSRPNCFPMGEAFPAEHSPTIMYSVDGFITPTVEEQEIQQDRMRGVKAIYTRGEGYTARTDSERTNYLMLSWFLKKNNQAMFTKSNIVLFEFAGSAAVPALRIIEAMQARPECGFAMYCKGSGSCWADTMLAADDTCIPEDEVLDKLKKHAEGEEDNSEWIIYLSLVCGSILGFCCMVACIGKLVMIMKGPRKAKEKEMEEPLAEAVDNVEDDNEHESTLPGSEVASDYGQQDTNDDAAP